MGIPGYQLKQRHKVVASLSGEDIGKEVWCIVCDLHPGAGVLYGICEECWRTGRRGAFTGTDFTIEQALKVMERLK